MAAKIMIVRAFDQGSAAYLASVSVISNARLQAHRALVNLASMRAVEKCAKISDGNCSFHLISGSLYRNAVCP